MPRVGRHGRIDFAYESTWASYTAPTHRLMIETEGLEHQLNNIEDNSLTGEIYTTDKILAGINETGSIDGNGYGDTIGILLWGVLGSEAAVSDPADAYVYASYTGSDQYARLTMSSNVLTAETSNDGSSWTVDSNFGSSGTLDVTDASADTATELANVINGYTGWSANYVGNSASDSANIADFAATEVKNDEDFVGVRLMPYQYSGSTTAKTHTVTPAGSTENLPSFSITVNRTLGTNASLGFIGCKFQNLTISTTASDLIKVSMGVDGKNRETGKTDSSLAMSNVKAFTAANCKIIMVKSDGTQVEFDETKDISCTLNTNVDDNRVVGSLYKLEQTRQNSTIDISFTCNNTSTQYAFDTEYTAGNAVELLLYFESATDCDTDNNIPYNVLLRFPRCIIDNFNSPLNTPDRLIITGAMTVTKPKNSTYTKHVYAYIVDNDTSLYSS